MVKLPYTPPSLKAWEDGWCLGFAFRSSLRNTLVVVANSIDNQLRNRGLDITDKEIQVVI